MAKAKELSQKTLVRVMEALEEYGAPTGELDDPGVNFTRFLYENEFPTWFVLHAETSYSFNWQGIIIDLRSGRFFFPGYSDSSHNVTGQYLSESEASRIGEHLNRRLAALAARTPNGEMVIRSLELDGYRASEKTLDLVALESIVSEQEEEDRVVQLIKRTGISNSEVILKHLRDASDLFVGGKDHPSIGEARSFVQALVDSIGTETHAHGCHTVGYPGGTKNRLQYLQDVHFFTPDESAAFGSAWGFLSGGSHPGISTQDGARISLILSLEFGQLLLLKFENWKVNGYKSFRRVEHS